jgi:protease secretion system membrane fusion protein
MNVQSIKSVAANSPADQAPEVKVNTDAGPYSKLGWGIVVVGIAGSLLWASVAPLDKGVPVSGTVISAGNRKTIQHQNGGTVADILVKEGDRVRSGQVLVRMNPVQATAAAEASRVQYIAARVTVARLLAEREGKTSFSLPPQLERLRDDPRVTYNQALQSQLLDARQAVLRQELAGLAENIAGLTQQLNGLVESQQTKKLQMQYLTQQLDGMRDLANEGYVARNRLLELERSHAQLTGAIAEDSGNIGRIRKQISELTLRGSQRQQEYRKEIGTQLPEAQREAEALENRLHAQQFDVDNLEIKAPVDGVVVGLKVFTQGAVIGPGFSLMEIVPSDDALIIEAQVPVNLVDKVHPGLPVELIFSAFNQNKTPHVPGEVTYVSADRLADPKTGVPYYSMKAKVTVEGSKRIADLQVRAGMPVEAFIKTGERTMMSYLFKPMIDRAHSSLAEE